MIHLGATTRRCLGCGEPVGPRFRRVFGDREDRVHACPACTGIEAIKRGAAADREVPSGMGMGTLSGRVG